ncbi:helix-turn-helix transcriptional regulator [Neisseria musculi]
MPHPFKLANSGKAIGWLESEIDDYIAKQSANRI